jgi:hypothetical protein
MNNGPILIPLEQLRGCQAQNPIRASQEAAQMAERAIPGRLLNRSGQRSIGSMKFLKCKVSCFNLSRKNHIEYSDV